MEIPEGIHPTHLLDLKDKHDSSPPERMEIKLEGNCKTGSGYALVSWQPLCKDNTPGSRTSPQHCCFEIFDLYMTIFFIFFVILGLVRLTSLPLLTVIELS